MFSHSVVSLCKLWTVAHQPSLSFTISWSLFKLMSMSQWCHPAISFVPFSSHPQSFPASGSFPVSQLLASDGQSFLASASVSVLPIKIQGWFPLALTGLISLQFKGLSRVFSSTTVWKHQILLRLAFFMVHLSHPYMTTGKTIALTRWPFDVSGFIMLFRFFLAIKLNHG